MDPTQLGGLDVEARASAMLKAVKVMMADHEPRNFTRIFSQAPAPALVGGHAWRAIRQALGTCRVPEKWQREASRSELNALLDRAIAFAQRKRNAHSGYLERSESGLHEKQIEVLNLQQERRRMDAVIAEALRLDAIREREGPIVLVNKSGRWMLAHAKSGRLVDSTSVKRKRKAA